MQIRTFLAQNKSAKKFVSRVGFWTPRTPYLEIALPLRWPRARGLGSSYKTFPFLCTARVPRYLGQSREGFVFQVQFFFPPFSDRSISTKRKSPPVLFSPAFLTFNFTQSSRNKRGAMFRLNRLLREGGRQVVGHATTPGTEGRAEARRQAMRRPDHRQVGRNGQRYDTRNRTDQQGLTRPEAVNPTVEYVGWATWSRDGRLPHDVQDAAMTAACTAAHGKATRAATYAEYHNNQIRSLPETNESDLWLHFTGPEGHGYDNGKGYQWKKCVWRKKALNGNPTEDSCSARYEKGFFRGLFFDNLLDYCVQRTVFTFFLMAAITNMIEVTTTKGLGSCKRYAGDFFFFLD